MTKVFEWMDADTAQTRRLVSAGVLVYFVASLVVLWAGRYRMNPDIVSYIQIAHHYAKGDFSLAVSSWWSPFFSWLLVPGIFLGVEPLLWAKLLQIPAGLGLAGAVTRLARQIFGGRGTLVACWLGLAASVLMATGTLSPDLWHACALSWYLVFAHRMLLQGGGALAFGVGAFGGATYLVKAFSLPFVVAHLVLSLVLRRLSKNGFHGWRRVTGEFALAMLGVALVAGPWIAMISRNDGERLINSAGKYWTQSQPLDPLELPPVLKPHPVRVGRISSMENPRELPLEWVAAPPFGPGTQWRSFLKMVRSNVNSITLAIGRMDGLGMIFVVLFLAVTASFPLRDSFQSVEWLSVLWSLASVAIYAGGYSLVFFTDRYLWPLWGLIAVLSAGVAPVAIEPGNAGSRSRVLARIVPAATLAAMSLTCITTVLLQRIGKETALANEVHRTARLLSPNRTFVSDDYLTGISFAYWSGGSFAGVVTRFEPGELRHQLGMQKLLTFVKLKESRTLVTGVEAPRPVTVESQSFNIYDAEPQ
jgi:hypothetical protein